MRVPVIEGVIRRRILANFSADPAVVARILPSPLRPQLASGRAVVGICLIRLEAIRPKHLPAAIGIASENAAHRIAVSWTDPEGHAREGVYIPRRDTDSLMNHLAGGRIFPGEHHHADSPLAIGGVRSSYFEDPERFPKGSIDFDFALLMRNIPHTWHSEPDLPIETAPSVVE